MAPVLNHGRRIAMDPVFNHGRRIYCVLVRDSWLWCNYEKELAGWLVGYVIVYWLGIQVCFRTF